MQPTWPPTWPPTWHADAACKGAGPDLFYGERGGSGELSDIAKARAICAVCPVQPECLAWGLAYEHHGVWGGASERERRRLRRQARLAS